MRLSKMVLDAVRGAGCGAVVLAAACSSQATTIHREPLAQLAPVSVSAPPAALHASPKPDTVAELELPPPPPTPEQLAASEDAGVHAVHHRPHVRRRDIIMAACGRG